MPTSAPGRRTRTARTTARTVPPAPREALLTVLGDPALAWVRSTVRARLREGGPGGTVTGLLQLLTATPAQRAAATRLLGPGAVRGTRVVVRVEEVGELLREVVGWEFGLAEAVRLLDQPERVVPVEVPVEVPAEKAVPVPVPVPVEEVVLPQTRVEAVAPRRCLDVAAADAAGLALVDVALVAGLPVRSGTGAGLDPDVPSVLTLAQLRADPPVWEPAPPRGAVLVCATPSVVAAVVAVPPAPGARRPPVVCLDASATSTAADPAWPGGAVGLVLDGLRAAGWTLLLSGGAGPEAEVLSELLCDEFGAQPWVPALLRQPEVRQPEVRQPEVRQPAES